MYDSLTTFMSSLSADSPLLWPLLVVGIVAVFALVLYTFWEVVLRLVATVPLSRKSRRRSTE